MLEHCANMIQVCNKSAYFSGQLLYLLAQRLLLLLAVHLVGRAVRNSNLDMTRLYSIHPMAGISDGVSEHVAHAQRKIGLS